MASTNRGQMIDQALQRVGNNSSSLKVQARYRLNRILQELHLGYDWPFLWATGDVTILPSGLVVMPPLFAKPEDDQSLSYTTISHSRIVMQEVDHRTFDARQTATIPFGHPRLWTLDYTRIFGLVTGRVWPRPDSPLPAQMRHKFIPLDQPVSGQATDAAYDEDIPAFPWDTFLSDALSEWAMAYEVDPRRAEQLQIDDERLARMRNATWPERSFPSTVQLDPLVFSTPTWGRGG